jgi:hypothetical protein
MYSGENIVEGVPMPIKIAAWMQIFVYEYHLDIPFQKHKQKKPMIPGKVA